MLWSCLFVSAALVELFSAARYEDDKTSARGPSPWPSRMPKAQNIHGPEKPLTYLAHMGMCDRERQGASHHPLLEAKL